MYAVFSESQAKETDIDQLAARLSEPHDETTDGQDGTGV